MTGFWTIVATVVYTSSPPTHPPLPPANVYPTYEACEKLRKVWVGHNADPHAKDTACVTSGIFVPAMSAVGVISNTYRSFFSVVSKLPVVKWGAGWREAYEGAYRDPAAFCAGMRVAVDVLPFDQRFKNAPDAARFNDEQLECPRDGSTPKWSTVR